MDEEERPLKKDLLLLLITGALIDMVKPIPNNKDSLIIKGDTQSSLDN